MGPSHWLRSIGTDGRDASERAVTIVVGARLSFGKAALLRWSAVRETL